MNWIAIIGCVVGIITCTVGIATFVSAQISRAKQDGVQMEKLDQCIRGIEEIKKSVKEKNNQVDKTLEEHTKDIIKLKAEMESMKEKLDK